MSAHCPRCQFENQPEDRLCRRCGAELLSGGEDYASKLISALAHPEPETPVRAAWILGELREGRAVDALTSLVKKSGDPYILAAAVEALGKIGDARATGLLAEALASSFLVVRLKAVEALGRLSGEGARGALESATRDPISSVREAATRTLRQWSMPAGERPSLSSPGAVIEASVEEETLGG